VLSERDRSVFRDLIESRVMTLSQISTLHFAGSYEYAKKRFQQFKAAEYVTERKRRYNLGHYSSSMLSLARPGFAAVADDPFVQDRAMSWDDLRERLDFAETTLTHELEVVDMKVAFTTAIRTTTGLTLDEFTTYPRRYEFLTENVAWIEEDAKARARGETPKKRRPFILKPDGYACVCGPEVGEQAVFFEWDRSTEAQPKLAMKAFGYQRYLDSGAFAAWNDPEAPDIDRYPCTPIYILPNEERRNNTAEHLLRVQHPTSKKRLRRDLILLTTHAEFLRDPLGSIYLTLDGYRRATKGTPYDPETHKALSRAKARDLLVSERVRKTPLLGGA
jgi:hypothetical protein